MCIRDRFSRSADIPCTVFIWAFNLPCDTPSLKWYASLVTRHSSGIAGSKFLARHIFPKKYAVMDCPVSVSYTHLDVYKRQVLYF